MAQEQIRSTLERYVAAWKASDVEALLGLYADDVVFHYAGTTDLAGDHVGRDAAVAAMVTASTRAQRELVDVIDVLAGGELGALVVHERLTRGDLSEVLRRTLLYRVRDGQIAECWVHDEDQRLVDRFWAPD